MWANMLLQLNFQQRQDAVQIIKYNAIPCSSFNIYI